MPRINLALLFGGASTEHEVSCRSAASIMTQINREKYNIFPIGITKTGKWLYFPDASPDFIASGAWASSPFAIRAIISPECGAGLGIFDGTSVSFTPLDCVFPVLHGSNGEDGSVQGLLQLAGIPCVGPLVAASAISMDKSLTRKAVRETGVRQTDSETVSRDEYAHAPEAFISLLESRFTYPMFVKPCRSGSSVGVSKADSRQALQSAIELAAGVDLKIMVEEYIDGREIEVAVLGNLDPVASVCGEIVPDGDFYSYDAKYNSPGSTLIIPAELPVQTAETARNAAVTVYKALGCAGLSRVDFFVRRDSGEVVFNEINTIPGFTSISMYPMLFEASGIPYPELIDSLVTLALENPENRKDL